ncbi:unnamed protein product, partial [Mesorhabditis spiculigera]
MDQATATVDIDPTTAPDNFLPVLQEAMDRLFDTVGNTSDERTYSTILKCQTLDEEGRNEEDGQVSSLCTPTLKLQLDGYEVRKGGAGIADWTGKLVVFNPSDLQNACFPMSVYLLVELAKLMDFSATLVRGRKGVKGRAKQREWTELKDSLTEEFDGAFHQDPDTIVKAQDFLRSLWPGYRAGQMVSLPEAAQVLNEINRRKLGKIYMFDKSGKKIGCTPDYNNVDGRVLSMVYEEENEHFTPVTKAPSSATWIRRAGYEIDEVFSYMKQCDGCGVYYNQNYHKNTKTCEAEPHVRIRCTTCHVCFQNKKCYDNHLRNHLRNSLHCICIAFEELGQLTSEIPTGWTCVSFVCPGSKQYAALLKKDGEEVYQEIIKTRGITQDLDNKGKLTFNRMKCMATQFVERYQSDEAERAAAEAPEPSIEFNYKNIRRPKPGVLETVAEHLDSNIIHNMELVRYSKCPVPCDEDGMCYGLKGYSFPVICSNLESNFLAVATNYSPSSSDLVFVVAFVLLVAYLLR